MWQNAVALHRIAERAGNFPVQKWQQCVAAINEMHFHAERRENAGVFAADNSGPDHRQLLRQPVQI